MYEARSLYMQNGCQRRYQVRKCLRDIRWKGTPKKTSFKLDTTPFGDSATYRANKISAAVGIDVLENNHFKVQVIHPSKKISHRLSSCQTTSLF